MKKQAATLFMLLLFQILNFESSPSHLSIFMKNLSSCKKSDTTDELLDEVLKLLIILTYICDDIY